MGNLFNTKQKTASSQTASGTTSNQAYGDVGQNLIGQSNAGGNATNILSSLLSGGAAGQQGFHDYQNSTGYQNQLDSMTRAITGNQAAHGLLRSGGTGTAIQTQANNLAQGSYNNYLSQLMGLAGLGNQSAGLLGSIAPTSSAQQSTGTGSTTQGNSTFGQLSTLAPLFGFSDSRLKRDIEQIGETESGLPLYNFRYVGDPEVQTGVMADDVEKLKPEALGPEIAGYRTVNYGAL